VATLTYRVLFSLALAAGFPTPQVAQKAVEGKPQAPVTEDDFKILDVVLVDLLEYKDFNTFSHKKDVSTDIILDTTTVGHSFYISQGQLDGEAYRDEEHAVSIELGDDLRKRNPKEPISLAGYKSPSLKIVVKKTAVPAFGEEISEDGAKAKHYVTAWLPGYSKDGNTAVFRATFGPTPHGATLTYKLAKKDGKWTIIWRKVSFYA
jgi:hypothetical protein